MTGRLITADARKVSGADFFRGIFGGTPDDREHKQRRLEAWRRINAEERATFKATKAEGQHDGETVEQMIHRQLRAVDEMDRRITARMAEWEAEYQAAAARKDAA